MSNKVTVSIVQTKWSDAIYVNGILVPTFDIDADTILGILQGKELISYKYYYADDDWFFKLKTYPEKFEDVVMWVKK